MIKFILPVFAAVFIAATALFIIYKPFKSADVKPSGFNSSDESADYVYDLYSDEEDGEDFDTSNLKRYKLTILGVEDTSWTGYEYFYAEGEEFYLNAPLKNGYEFSHFSGDDGNTYYANRKYVYNFGGDLVLTPVYVKP